MINVKAVRYCTDVNCFERSVIFWGKVNSRV